MKYPSMKNGAHMLENVDHIGIAVNDLDEAMKLYRGTFGMEPTLVYESAYTKAKIAFFQVGHTKIELIQPVEEESVMGKFLAKNGEGIHHLAYAVKDIEESLRDLEKNGIRLIDKKSRQVRETERVAFLHPKSTNGVLVELVQVDE
jgi:methylmalonyl-CoA/ethylmalonyl-CoA epimerase